jgi:hypothetical protein
VCASRRDLVLSGGGGAGSYALVEAAAAANMDVPLELGTRKGGVAGSLELQWLWAPAVDSLQGRGTGCKKDEEEPVFGVGGTRAGVGQSPPTIEVKDVISCTPGYGAGATPPAEMSSDAHCWP